MIVLIPLLLHVPVLQTVVAVRPIVLSVRNEMPESVRVPVTVLVPVPETVVAETDRAVGDGRDA